jgi:hypothetical protein
MIKVITFWVGVDILGFPLLHNHILKFKQPSKYIVGYDPYKSDGTGSIGIITKRNIIDGEIVATYHSRKHLENESKN